MAIGTFRQLHESAREIIKDCDCRKCAANQHTFEAHDEDSAKRKPRQSPDFQQGALTKAIASWDVMIKGGPGGGNWTPVPKGQKGGFRRGQPGSYEYWYPGSGQGKDAKPATHEQHFSVGDYNLTVVAQAQGSLSPEDVKRAKDIAKKMKSGIDKAADVCKLSPPVCQGNLGIPRMHMPQIMEKSIKEMAASSDPEDRKKAQAAIASGADPNSDVSIKDQLLAALKFKGVKITQEAIPVGQLKATQREIKAGKTFGMADAFLRGKYKPQDAQIIISSDNHILDGHHRWASLVTAAPETKMKVLRVDMPMHEFLQASFNQAGVFRADLQGDIVDPSIPLDLSGNDKEDVNYDAPSKPAPSVKDVAATKPDQNTPQALGVTAQPDQSDQQPQEEKPKPDPTKRGTKMGPEAKKEYGKFTRAAKKIRHNWNDYPDENALFHTHKSEIFEADLIKAEGDRGGHVIGHTSTGKPIYETAYRGQAFTHKHTGWQKIDHEDAADDHMHQANIARNKATRAAGKPVTSNEVAYHKYMAQAYQHAAAGNMADANGYATTAAGMFEPKDHVPEAATAKSLDHIKEQAMLFDPLDLVKGVSTEEIEVRKAQVAREEFTALDGDDLAKADRDTLAMVRGPRTPPAGSRVRVGGVAMTVAPAAQLTNERSRPGMRPPQPVLPRQHDRSEVTGFTRAPDGTIMDPRSGLRSPRIRKSAETFEASDDEGHLAKAKGPKADYFRTVAHHDIPFTGTPGHGQQVGGYPVGKHVAGNKRDSGFDGHEKDAKENEEAASWAPMMAGARERVEGKDQPAEAPPPEKKKPAPAKVRVPAEAGGRARNDLFHVDDNSASGILGDMARIAINSARGKNRARKSDTFIVE